MSQPFQNRHIGITTQQEQEMLLQIGVQSLDELIDKTVPQDIRLAKKMDLPEPMSEYELLHHVSQLASKNKIYKTYIGLGYHPTILPSVIQRNILENAGWYTAYTPYQAEIAQGRLEALLNYQTMISDLTGMDITNASLLDEGTAAAEAMGMLWNTRTREQKKENVNRFFVSDTIFPQTLAVLETRAEPLGIELVVGKVATQQWNTSFFGAIFQYPDKFGKIQEYKTIVDLLHQSQIKVVVAADILSLAIVTPPGEWGADVVVGSTQRLGIPMGYGGPHAAYFSTKEEYKRDIPGRIIGVTQDADGNRALRMALQTREQHIKREKATSNICTAQVLLAVMAGMYGVYHGAEGLKQIAQKIHQFTTILDDALQQMGFEQLNDYYFDTLHIKTDKVEQIREIALENELNLGYIEQDAISISLNETTSESDVKQLIQLFEQVSGTTTKTEKSSVKIPQNLQRTSAFMTHEVFQLYHSETEMMRYIKKLENRDLALNRSMISLGSCTMKLNSATSMLPLSWSNWGGLHPFVPVEQALGYQEMLHLLELYLNEITGFAATSLQPNSGAQGEYAGLLTIRSYQKSIGQSHRNIVLIPASAHGTNPASAVMAGYEVVVIKTTEHGEIDVTDLQQKAEQHQNHLAALMVTYPSTHGVFEDGIQKITQIIHQFGGLVYMDGANMNAQVGLTNPATIGADVCHLNLHKTFAIPHGGGGPGVGPICCTAALAPFLPQNPMVKVGGRQGVPGVSAAPYGSALVDLISYAYIRMLGAEGLTQSTRYAILNANYLKVKLAEHYSILYSGSNGFVAHEMIVDFREFKKTGIEVVDIAKRLMDYGYHAPTVSFPVAGTLMIEPTESEDKTELDRFISALVHIKTEINTHDKNDEKNSVVKNAPHTQAMVLQHDWSYSYSREQAVFPLPYVQENKFWPFVRRVDDAYGDRNLVCSCNPIDDYL